MKDNRQGRIIITGASGMLGFYLVRKLMSEGYEKLVLPLRKTSNLSLLETLPIDQVKIIRTDLRHVANWRQILQPEDTIVHAAATLGFGVSHEKIDAVNRVWTKTIVDEAIASQVSRFVYISSVAALNRMKKGLVTEEDRFEFPELEGAYGKSKYKAEKEVWRGEAEGLEVIVFNPSQILGLGHYGQINSRFLNYFEKLYRFYPQGGLGVVDVRDVADAIAGVLKSDEMWGRQFILNAKNMSYETFINGVRERMQLRPLSRALPSWVHRYGHPFFALYHSLQGKPNPFTTDYLRKLEHTFKYDNKQSLEIPDFIYRDVKDTLDDWVKSFIQTRHNSFGILPP